MVNLELYNIVEDIKSVSKAFVVNPKFVTAETATSMFLSLSFLFYYLQLQLLFYFTFLNNHSLFLKKNTDSSSHLVI